jgi:hypothetical protein
MSRGIRGGKFYCVDSTTGTRASLGTSVEDVAEILERREQAVVFSAFNPKAAVEVSSAGTRDSVSEPFPWLDGRLERQQPQELPLGFQLRRS